MTLLEETLKEMTKHEVYAVDIIFIGSRDGRFSCSWEEFKNLYLCVTGYMASDLIIRFKDGGILIRVTEEGWDIGNILNLIVTALCIRSKGYKFLMLIWN